MSKIDVSDIQGFALRGYNFPYARYLLLELLECEKAQQTMQLTLPESANLPSKSRKPKSTNHRNIIGGAALFSLLLGLMIWVIQSARRGGRRRQRSLARRRHDE